MSLSIHTASAPAFLQILKAFEAVIDNLPVGVTVMSATGEFIVFNPTARSIFGRPGDGVRVAGVVPWVAT